jgi:hypothetical protein
MMYYRFFDFIFASSLVRKVVLLGCLGGTLLTVGCVKSSSPAIEELIKTRPPTFSGSTNFNGTTPSSPYLLNGECDPISYGLEYSYDNATWTDVAGGCPAGGTWSITLVFAGSQTVYARARTKNGYTSVSRAIITIVIPPNASMFSLVASGHSDPHGGLGTQNSISHGIAGTADPLANGAVKLHLEIPGITYGN